jgi:hypothetical protein
VPYETLGVTPLTKVCSTESLVCIHIQRLISTPYHASIPHRVIPRPSMQHQVIMCCIEAVQLSTYHFRVPYETLAVNPLTKVRYRPSVRHKVMSVQRQRLSRAKRPLSPAYPPRG